MYIIDVHKQRKEREERKEQQEGVHLMMNLQQSEPNATAAKQLALNNELLSLGGQIDANASINDIHRAIELAKTKIKQVIQSISNDTIPNNTIPNTISNDKFSNDTFSNDTFSTSSSSSSSSSSKSSRNKNNKRNRSNNNTNVSFKTVNKIKTNRKSNPSSHSIASKKRSKLPKPDYRNLTAMFAAGVIQPGKKILSCPHKGIETYGDVTMEGQIKLGNLFFKTPSAFSAHVKGRPDNGWTSVLYKDVYLSEYRYK